MKLSEKQIHIIYTLIFMFAFVGACTALCKDVQPDPVVIMNLHMENGKITLNSLHMAKVRLHRRAKRNTDNFMVFYNKSGKKLTEKYFNIPRKMHFDYIDEKTKKLQGATMKRDKVDFVLKIPYSKGMKKIDFFELGNAKKTTSSEKKLMGTVELDEYAF